MRCELRPALAGVALCAHALSAQVGRPPERSPYRDLEYRQEFSTFAGSFGAKKDPLGIAPRSGTMVGARYEIRLGGPAYFYSRVAGAALERTVIDPKQAPAARAVGSERVPLLFGDAGLQLHLTGFKSWHGLVPLVSSGLGLTANLKGKDDIGLYRFGTPFTLTFGGGLKWTTGPRWQWRVDLYNVAYRIHYPETYYIKQGEGDPVLGPNEKKDLWRRNRALTIGVSYVNFR
jgi:hypothetical protein